MGSDRTERKTMAGYLGKALTARLGLKNGQQFLLLDTPEALQDELMVDGSTAGSAGPPASCPPVPSTSSMPS